MMKAGLQFTRDRERASARNEVLEIDEKIAKGAQVKGLARQYGLSGNGLYNHARHHITEAFKQSVRLGPLQSAEQLAELCADVSVDGLQRLRVVTAAVSRRWLLAFETDAHDRFIDLTVQLRKLIELELKRSGELTPAGTTVTNNVVFLQSPEYLQAIAGISHALRPFPEARARVAAALRQLSAAGERPMLLEQSVSA
jgi:hypothetical protein